MFFASKRDKENWRDLDGLDAVSWLKKGSGKKAYEVLWDRLFRLKFHDFTDNLSAAWIWARIRRVGQSRRSIFQESLGYIEGVHKPCSTSWLPASNNKGAIFICRHRSAMSASKTTG